MPAFLFLCVAALPIPAHDRPGAWLTRFPPKRSGLSVAEASLARRAPFLRPPTRPPQQRRCRCGGWKRASRRREQAMS
jgi:hypothetical protein